MTAHKHFKLRVRSRMEKTGESYTSARRALLLDADTPANAPERAGDLRLRHHLPGVIPATAALRILVAAAGTRDPRTSRPPTETLLFAIAGGIGIGVASFVYEKEDFASLFVGGRHVWYDDALYLGAALQRLGIPFRQPESAGAKAADRALREALAGGDPCVAFVDAAMLPHRCLPQRFQGGGYHVVTVYAIDEARAIAWIGDLTDQPIEIPLSRLAAARARIKKFKNRLIFVDADARPRTENTPAELTQERLAAAARSGLKACHDGLTARPMKAYPTMFNLDGLAQLADRMHGSRDPLAWERAFTPGQRLWTALTSLHDFVENYGTGGGLCRPFFATGLRECGVLLDDARLGKLAERYDALGRAWTELSDAALPRSVPLFREAREQYALRSELLSAAAADDAARLTEVAATWKRLDALRESARVRFPLTDGECEALRRDLQERLRTLHAGEVAAHAELGEIVDGV